MKKAFTLFILFFIITTSTIFSQPWHYDFGTGTGSFSTSNTASTTFLPTPLSGIARVKVSNGGGGSFNLENFPQLLGSETYLRIPAPTGGSVNKFSIYDYSPGTSFTIRFNIRFGSSSGSATANSGIWYFFAGDGADYSNSNNFTGTMVFSGLRFTFGTSGSIVTNYRSGGAWSTAISGSPFVQGVNYVVEIYGNNSSSTQNYTYINPETIAANTWDLWVNGVLVGNDLSKGQLANNVPIDSWMFNGESSTGNAANIFLDEIDYHNDLAGTPLPVTMGSFNLYGNSRSATLTWSTTSELNNSGFDIERSIVSGSTTGDWQKIAFVQGSGSTNEPKSYSFSDNNLKAGNYKYRLKQIDYNGNFEYFSPANADYITIVSPNVFSISQNYPNPSNPVSKIDYQIPFSGNVNLTVYDVTGKAVIELVNGFQTADYHTVTFNGNNLASGIYFYRISVSSENSNFTRTMKMVLVK